MGHNPRLVISSTQMSFIMQEHRKDLTLFVSLSAILFLIGLSITWYILRSDIVQFLQTIKFQLIAISLIFALVGLVGCNYEVQVISKYIQVIDSNTKREWPVNRKLILKIFFGAISLGLLVLFFNYATNGTDALLHGAYYMILLGIGSTITFGIMLVCVYFNNS